MNDDLKPWLIYEDGCMEKTVRKVISNKVISNEQAFFVMCAVIYITLGVIYIVNSVVSAHGMLWWGEG